MKAICAAGDSSFWTGPFTFNTLISCPKPTNLSASNTTASSSDLSWTAGGTEIAWDIQYGASGFIPGNGTSVTVASNPYTLTGLTGTTTYDYYVKAICAAGDSSFWTGPFTFNTLISCPQPSALGASNITACSDLSWTAGGTETAWDIQYGSFRFYPLVMELYAYSRLLTLTL